MNSSPPSTSATTVTLPPDAGEPLDGLEPRLYSTVQRRQVAGETVFVKQCLPGCRYQSPAAASAQVGREVELLARLAEVPGRTRRLGVMRVVEHDAAQAMITTAEVPGASLTAALMDRSTTGRRGAVRALYLAGKWPRLLQALPVAASVPRSTPSNPEDLVEHCELRLRILADSPSPWPDSATRDLLVRRLREWVASTPADQLRRVWCHGDYGPYNLIWDGRQLTPLDFAAAAPDVPLADPTYLIHRLEMLALRYPWRAWPLAAWKRACWRGYGLPDAERQPLYRALMVRYLLSRLKKLAEQSGLSLLGKCHQHWSRRMVRAKLAQLIGSRSA